MAIFNSYVCLPEGKWNVTREMSHKPHPSQLLGDQNNQPHLSLQPHRLPNLGEFTRQADFD